MTWTAIPGDTTSNVGVSFNNGVWTSSTTSSWGHRAKSSEEYDSTKSVKFTASSGVLVMAGFGVDPYDSYNNSYQDVEYAWYYTAAEGKWYIYESGQDILNFSGNASDTGKIERNGSTIKYYHNDVLKRTVTNTSTADMYFHAAFGSGGSITCQTTGGSSGGGSSGGGEEESTPNNTDGSSLIEHILYLNTRVPK